MKKMLWLIAIVSVCVAAPAAAAPVPAPPTYVAVVRVTPGASPAKILAFQNIDSGQDVIIRRIDFASASTQTITGGLMQFWVYTSTSLVHSNTTTLQHYKFDATLAATPAAISASTAPLSVQYEGDTGILSAAQSNSLSGTAVPILRPFIINSSTGAQGQFSDGWGEDIQSGLASMPLVLPHNANRAIVVEKRQAGPTDFTSTPVLIRIFYTLR